MQAPPQTEPRPDGTITCSDAQRGPHGGYQFDERPVLAGEVEHSHRWVTLEPETNLRARPTTVPLLCRRPAQRNGLRAGAGTTVVLRCAVADAVSDALPADVERVRVREQDVNYRCGGQNLGKGVRMILVNLATKELRKAIGSEPARSGDMPCAYGARTMTDHGDGVKRPASSASPSVVCATPTEAQKRVGSPWESVLTRRQLP